MAIEEPAALVSLREIDASLAGVDSQLADLRSKKERTPAEAQQLTALEEQRAKLASVLETTATGIESRELDETGVTKWDATAEVQELLRPLVSNLKETTQKLRDVESLRRQIRDGEQRLARADKALAHIEELTVVTKEPMLRKELDRFRSEWKNRRSEIEGRLNVARLQLGERLQERRSITDYVTLFMTGFVIAGV